MADFVGRERELECLEFLCKKRSSSFVVLQGKKQIGKTRLISQFGKKMRCHIFTGEPPTQKTTRQSQLDTICGQISREFGFPPFSVNHWADVFTLISKQTSKGRVVVALDEISWMCSKDHIALGHLKNAWDLELSRNPKLILILCGSDSKWIETNVLRSTGFVGRFSRYITLNELSIKEIAKFWAHKGKNINSHDVVQMALVTGGIPGYLEHVKTELSAEDNIRRLCFHEKGVLFHEFNQIFSEFSLSKANGYIRIIQELSSETQTFKQLHERLSIPKSTLSIALADLIQADLVKDDSTWDLKRIKPSTIKRYRLSDNYLIFYLNYIFPNKNEIEQGILGSAPLSNLPKWDGVRGLQFQNLVLNNIKELIPLFHLRLSDISFWGPFFQRPTKRQKGCQIDLLIQTRFRTVLLCEVKFSGKPLGVGVARKAKEQQERISLPKGWSSRLALIHVNGVTDEVHQADVFDHIVDFSDLLTN